MADDHGLWLAELELLFGRQLGRVALRDDDRPRAVLRLDRHPGQRFGHGVHVVDHQLVLAGALLRSQWQ